MKLRILTLIGVCCLLSGTLSARQKSVIEAQNEANSLLQSRLTRSTGKLTQITLAHTEYDSQGKALYYVFNREPNAGYVIISADDCAKPILGVTETGNFDVELLPPGLRYLLSYLGEEIHQGIVKETLPYSAVEYQAYQNRTSVAPLLQTAWNQLEPFNYLCPLYNGSERAATGCVATAMAQVMKYYQHPSQGIGQYSYTNPADGKTYSANFGNTKYRWDLMSYSGMVMGEVADPENAISTLMYHCGVSVRMQYGYGGSQNSGAYAQDIPSALKTYFDYDPNVRFVKANTYSTTQFNELMYNEISHLRPVILEGYNTAGHTFVCDGYNAQNDLFHINWGWSGMSDGEFSLTSLNPSQQGVGGSSGGYTGNLGVVIGIQPRGTVTHEGSFKLEILEASFNIASGKVNPSVCPLTIRVKNAGDALGSSKIVANIYDSNHYQMGYMNYSNVFSLESGKELTFTLTGYNATGGSLNANSRYQIEIYEDGGKEKLYGPVEFIYDPNVTAIQKLTSNDTDIKIKVENNTCYINCPIPMDEIKIYAMDGRVILSKKVENKEATISMEPLLYRGIYLVQIKSHGKSFYKKISF